MTAFESQIQIVINKCEEKVTNMTLTLINHIKRYQMLDNFYVLALYKNSTKRWICS